MDTEDGLIVALILSKRLRTMLLKASLAAPVVGIIWTLPSSLLDGYLKTAYSQCCLRFHQFS